MNFSESQYGTLMIEKLLSQRDSGFFSDIEFIVQGQSFKAHRNVLAANSPCCLAVFNTNEVIQVTVSVQCCENAKAFKSFLSYMYTGCVVIDDSNVQDLMRLSRNFMVTKLMCHCEIYLRVHLDCSNCCVAYELADRYNLAELKKRTHEFITNHTVETLASKGLLSFNPNKLKDFLRDITFPPVELLDFICKWIEEDVDNRKNSFVDLLIFIDWKNVNSKILAENLKTCHFLLRSNSRRENFMKTLKDNKVTLPRKAFFEIELAASKIEKSSKSENISPTQENGDPQEIIDHGNSMNMGILEVYSAKDNTLSRHYVILKDGDTVPVDESSDDTVINEEPILPIDENSDDDDDDDEHSGNFKGLWEGDFKCDKCAFATFNEDKLISHINKIHNKLDATYVCPLCEFKCKWSLEYYSHLKIHYEGPPYKCKECNFTCKIMSKMSYHHFKHSKERYVLCVHCGQYFKTVHSLKYHVRARHSLDKPFECELCGKKFTLKSLLTHHTFTHRKDRLYLCDSCGYSTKKRHNLYVHRRIHTSNIRYCDHPGCKFSTVYPARLKNHKMCHSGERPFICSFCGSKFTAKSTLTSHERIHLGSLKCNFCDFTTPRQYRMNQHVQKHHDYVSPKKPFVPRKHRVMRFNQNPEPLSPARTTQNPMIIGLGPSSDRQGQQDRYHPSASRNGSTNQASVWFGEIAAALQQINPGTSNLQSGF